ncbi:hypothetical protein ABT186_01870 [Streptomyces sp. NPDC001634]|uniref:hypothetical protein n=1 Tax=Streptomyces sp. NPDC001634 TaxID=3154390 RepID=UPI00332593AF
MARLPLTADDRAAARVAADALAASRLVDLSDPRAVARGFDDLQATVAVLLKVLGYAEGGARL